MSNKILKKIVSWFGYKLVDKNLIKNKRVLKDKYLNLDSFLNYLFSKNLINTLIQIGANDGLRFDPLNKYLKKYETKTIFIEPIKKYFDELKINYLNRNNSIFENSAISYDNKNLEIFRVKDDFLKLYDEHIAGISSFNKKHLINHNVKEKHIMKQIVNSITLKNLMKKYNLNEIDLIFIDVEGYEGEIIIDFFKTINLRPIMIFEFIHIENSIFKKVIESINQNKYLYIEMDENLICFPKEKKFLIKQSNL